MYVGVIGKVKAISDIGRLDNQHEFLYDMCPENISLVVS